MSFRAVLSMRIKKLLFKYSSRWWDMWETRHGFREWMADCLPLWSDIIRPSLLHICSAITQEWILKILFLLIADRGQELQSNYKWLPYLWGVSWKIVSWQLILSCSTLLLRPNFLISTFASVLWKIVHIWSVQDGDDSFNC